MPLFGTSIVQGKSLGSCYAPLFCFIAWSLTGGQSCLTLQSYTALVKKLRLVASWTLNQLQDWTHLLTFADIWPFCLRCWLRMILSLCLCLHLTHLIIFPAVHGECFSLYRYFLVCICHLWFIHLTVYCFFFFFLEVYTYPYWWTCSTCRGHFPYTALTGGCWRCFQS